MYQTVLVNLTLLLISFFLFFWFFFIITIVIEYRRVLARVQTSTDAAHP